MSKKKPISKKVGKVAQVKEKVEKKLINEKKSDLLMISKSFILKYKFDLLILTFLIGFFLITNIMTTSKMDVLPSPLYGGDLYYQLGCVNHVKDGGNPFENCNLRSDNPGYFPLYSMIVGNFANITNMDSIDAMLFMSSVFIILSVILSYIFLRLMFDDFYVSALGVMLYLNFTIPILKYTDFTQFVIVPLFLISLYLFYEKQNYKRGLFLGITIGLSSISHSTMLPVSFFLTGFVFFFLLVKGNLMKRKTYLEAIERFKKNFILFSMILIIGFLISLTYWYEPIFVNHGKTSEHYLEWNGHGDMNDIGFQFEVLSNIVKGFLFSYSNIIATVISLSVVLGILMLILLKNQLREKSKFILILFSGVLIITLSYLITVPLLNIHFVPYYIRNIIGYFSAIVFAMSAIFTLIVLLRKKFNINHKILIPIFIVLILSISYTHLQDDKNYRNSHAFSLAVEGRNVIYDDLGKYIRSNTDVNDVILTTKEVGFAINSLSGRKLMVGRRAQNDAFENMDVREMDAGIILYGNNEQLRRDLIEKYGIDYLYWDSYWIRSEYIFTEDYRLQGIFDPLLAFYSPEVESYMSENGVQLRLENFYVDPSLRTENHPRFDLLMVDPANYRSFDHPWAYEMDPILEEVWSYEANGLKYARLFKIKR